mmetsp:Transcript_35864/g.101529  ORF Transcript_35864/g.101529 Transcript_35864/m.101529 type:complete len:232 (+) Transcript_35864:620-1315(+)
MALMVAPTSLSSAMTWRAMRATCLSAELPCSSDIDAEMSPTRVWIFDSRMVFSAALSLEWLANCSRRAARSIMSAGADCCSPSASRSASAALSLVFSSSRRATLLLLSSSSWPTLLCSAACLACRASMRSSSSATICCCSRLPLLCRLPASSSLGQWELSGASVAPPEGLFGGRAAPPPPPSAPPQSPRALCNGVDLSGEVPMCSTAAFRRAISSAVFWSRASSRRRWWRS